MQSSSRMPWCCLVLDDVACPGVASAAAPSKAVFRLDGFDSSSSHAQLNRALLGLKDLASGLAWHDEAIARALALGIQAGRLEANLNDNMVSSKDFCGEGVDISPEIPLREGQCTELLRAIRDLT